MNVVSTSPSGTEICYALGVEPVAVSHACDYPPAVEEKPRINTSRISSGSSADRHEQVRSSTADGHVYDVDLERLREAAPDLIISQSVCGVCAVDEPLIASAVADLDCDPRIIGLSANRLADVFTCISVVGESTGEVDRAAALVASLEDRLGDIEAATAASESRPRTVVIEWMDPLHLGANWVPELVEIAGGSYDLVGPGDRSTAVSWDDIVDYDPEALIVTPCSYPVNRTIERIDELRDRDGWESLSAVQDGKAFAMAGSSYLTRWTPRLVDATERLAAILHPAAFGPPPADVVRIPDR